MHISLSEDVGIVLFTTTNKERDYEIRSKIHGEKTR